MGEERNNNIHCWEARTGELHRPLKSSNPFLIVWHSRPKQRPKMLSGYARLLFLCVELGTAIQSIEIHICIIKIILQIFVQYFYQMLWSRDIAQHNIQELFVCDEIFDLLSLDHYGVIRHMVHCPTQPVLMTCGEDCRIKFWGHTSS